MEYGEYFYLLGQEWAQIHFVENNGMAFGLSLGGDYGKLALSLFRIAAVLFLIYYIRKLIEMKTSFGLLLSFALILAGALGNILDSAFYGMLFSDSSYHGGIAEFMPEGGGYAKFLHGKVVDMLYFPLVRGTFPSWFPFWGDEPFLFFRPVFNLADTSITIGVLNIILFQRSFFAAPEEEIQEEDPKEETKTDSEILSIPSSDNGSEEMKKSDLSEVETKDEEKEEL